MTALDNGNKLRRVIQKFRNISSISTLAPSSSATTTIITHIVATSINTNITWGNTNATTILFNVTTPPSEIFSNISTVLTTTDPYYQAKESRFTITQSYIIGTIAAMLSLLTVGGNILVMVSFKIDKTLQTISNYFLFSLAVADFAIGLISMPLFTVYTIMGYWPLGPMVCDTWLALDYLASNASVLNLLIISFDRYFSVTRPLTYRAKRTTKKAACMIGKLIH
uniref:Muscarinic acetylcholine receptor DM1 n=1 Tax=Cacopsylla melanoneura TaxID=428564 RepID=A0A8D8WVJ1_9HEMI